MSIKKEKNRKKGFTLVEMMVSVGIFTLVVTMGIVSLTTVMKTYRHSEEKKKVTDSLDYVLENLTRELRLGKNYYYAPDANHSGEALDGEGTIVDSSFIGFDASDNRGYMIYFLKDGIMGRKIFESDGSSFTEALTDKSQITIEKVQIRVMNTSKDDDKQPLVWLQVVGKTPKNSKEFTVQTLVSQREIDAPESQT